LSGIIDKFGNVVCSQIEKGHPAAARKLLLAGFRAFGLNLKVNPDKRLPESRRYIAVCLNGVMSEALIHPERAALVSLFMPCEIIRSMGINPLCAELFSAFISGASSERAFIDAAEKEGISETFCSYHKILMGSAYTGVIPMPAAIVNTSAICDANNLTFRSLSDYYGIPQFYLDVPPEDSDDSVSYVADQLRSLPKFLEEVTGKKFSEDKLKEMVAVSGKTIDNFLEAQKYRAVRRLGSDSSAELYEIYATHIGLGTADMEKYSEMLLNDYRNAPVDDHKGLRILWVHTIPNWQQPVRRHFNLSEEAQIIGCDLNWESLIHMDPEHPYESMARRLTSSRFNGRGDRRIKSAVDMAKKLNADGAVIFCHWGCKETMGLSAGFKDAFEEAGFPSLILNGDGADRSNTSDGQVETRLGAFIEMLKERRN
jgi:benzoyl-CoA reductase/2-hydroxyglutaryl-CoA dehydratase subunit BcrC/BadD/HgdB